MILRTARVLLLALLGLLIRPSAAEGQQVSGDTLAVRWLYDSSQVNPVYRGRNHTALLPSVDTIAVLLLICDAQRNLYIQFGTRPLAPARGTIAGHRATRISYRFDNDHPQSGLLLLDTDNQVSWTRRLERLGGLDSGPFWRKLQSANQLVVSFDGQTASLFPLFQLPSNTRTIVRAIRDSCR
jgi:hypothetical protein